MINLLKITAVVDLQKSNSSMPLMSNQPDVIIDAAPEAHIS
jgi:hypothetical protein